MLRSLLLLLSLTFAVGCNPHAEGCEAVCRKFVSGCEFSAWSNVTQCQEGCMEDMYRRSDATEVLACYTAAVDAPARASVEATLDRALEHGFFADEVTAGTFDREAKVAEGIEAGTCDLFAVVQCKVDAVQIAPTGPFLD
ncbi:MAG: hypothetical protein GY898_20945 [Proteobacteria bacterium]|nr:hypothetical protein [Pseudomonadota bacterium]